MRAKRLSLVLLCAFMAFATTPTVRQALAEDAPKADPGLSDVLTDLLHGVEGENATSGPDKRVPFGREEVQLSFAPLVKQTAPAVVNVYASQTAKVVSPFEGDPFFEEFFGRAQPRAQSSLGSGVLVDPSGVIVTNFHVIKNADEVKVATADGREFTSKVMLKDETLDLAVLKIESDKPFPVIAIGDSDALEVGDLVLAIGNPFGVGQTTTSGIVSALARSHIGVSDSGYFIQTDAAINPGNSGGALINMGGQLVGINTAIFSRSGGSIGIGFAIPANMVRAFADAAKAGLDFFERPYIGAEFEAVTPQIAESLGMEKPAGALVSSVDASGPAGKAGLKPGDVVLQINGKPVESIEALDYRMATLSIGTKANFAVLTKGQQAAMDIALERAPEGAKPSEVTLHGRSPFSGAKVAELSPRLAQKLGLRTDIKGVTVVDINRDSPAADFGFQPGDIVREVNGTTIDTAATLAQASQQDTRWWRFTVERGGQILRQVLRY
ncbi:MULTISPECIES: DegQ family serine endoprotease [unclassified Mesorhizobium]|uniref:DegQ family serine endoprotease n=1 Tax=unclassified Mesorhizobium TaxID=325217 RepID=UPI00112AB1C1|nr:MULTISPECIES: DegQ family serine endoprotease [unclassified Mesorhizobium]TPJ46242.1 DegQ family serine endoprotease [Mesorhizobium sp. B2-6-6]MBZ9704094.1 DegQ family serine endoprotease [Mesorhizobium sp. CO1-1-3]MBZ9916374.1 DegQ family serine endoprotease [Mesorhizobium sp. BR1-1-7]MBZ9950296.1 DegQ family serine endoprotease [Mesorhizobium sp. BR1-1-11]MBZ9956077.1 DegQ family serine endoprotease [Mesorhizobium sp. BR1-1-15]